MRKLQDSFGPKVLVQVNLSVFDILEPTYWMIVVESDKTVSFSSCIRNALYKTVYIKSINA